MIEEIFAEINYFIENPNKYELLYFKEDKIHNEYPLNIKEAEKIINYMKNLEKENQQLKKELEEYCTKEIEREEQERLDYLIEQEEAFNQYNDFEFEDYMYGECDNNDC